MQLLPLGKQTFLNAAGQPLAFGKVFFYIPNTSTLATTYQDAAGTTPNQNPVPLDGNGQAVIYGAGSFRQVVQDANGVTIWDQVTGDGGISGLGQSGPGLGVNMVAGAAAKVASIAALRALRVPTGSDAQTVIVDGYATAGDGGGGVMTWWPNSSQPDDGVVYFNPTANTGPGRFVRNDYSIFGMVNVRWAGAGNGGDDTAALKAAFAYAGHIHFPAGTYNPTDIIPLVSGNTYRITGDGAIIRPTIGTGIGNLSWWFGAATGQTLSGCQIEISGITFDGTNIPTNCYSTTNQGTKTPLVLWGGDMSTTIKSVSVHHCRFINLQNQYQPTQRNDTIDPSSANYWNKGSGGINVQFVDKFSAHDNTFDSVWSYPIMAKNVTEGKVHHNSFNKCFNANIGIAGGSYVVTGNIGTKAGTYGIDVGESGEVIQTTNVTILGNSMESMGWYYGVLRVQGAVNFTITGNVFKLIPVDSSIYPFYTARRNTDVGAVAQTDIVMIQVKQPPSLPAGSTANMVCSGNVLHVGDIIQHGIYCYLDSASNVPLTGLSIRGNVIGHLTGTNAEALTRAYIRVQRSTNTFVCGGIDISGNTLTARYAKNDAAGYSLANDRPIMVNSGTSNAATGNINGLSILGNLINPASSDSVTVEFLNLDYFINDVVIGNNNLVGSFIHRPLCTPSIFYVDDMNFKEDAMAQTQSLAAADSVWPIASAIPISCTAAVTLTGEVVRRTNQKDGKIVRLTNVSANNITLQNGSAYGLTLAAATRVLTPNSTITLMYDKIFNTWRENGVQLF